ncbi:uncharacterized protein CMU_009040 [Cryptosporidium muris RN66]|uniref:Uncharacterized protein n=1 Tax=Cryptosporidium muris (strain RN66) TaxID=441375 RepID=B6ADX1_CRYMR|nr:uncharacterized protein CMU_009040 [Cryptosporidium muris RN66]EEA06412.1 hypothetical protein, conserved [Cryptosporidium muris RN66]|eukprot:XP_002140761.1 hypothetical protein [Cryptosporidium muris RN66]
MLYTNLKFLLILGEVLLSLLLVKITQASFVHNNTEVISNNHTSWFNLPMSNEFLNYEINSMDLNSELNDISKIIRLAPSTNLKDSNWIPFNIEDFISIFKSKLQSTKAENNSTIQNKYNAIVTYLESINPLHNKVKSDTINSDKKSQWNEYFNFPMGIFNKTNKNKNQNMPITENISITKTNNQNLNKAKIKNEQNADLLEKKNKIDICNISIVTTYKDCIEECKRKLKKSQRDTGGITPLHISELNTCFQGCKYNVEHSVDCELSAETIKLINEEIQLPVPTIRRNIKKEKNKHGILYRYIFGPLIRLCISILFCLVGIIGILYYFRQYKLYPRFADTITRIIESYYTEEEKRRAIFEGNNFPQKPSVDWKRSLIYIIRLNFLPNFFATNLSWLVPQRRDINQPIDSSNYIQMS